MTVRLVHRPTRITRPLRPAEEEQLASPPQLPEGPVGGPPVQMLIPVLGAVTSVVMIVVYRGASNPIFLLVGAVILVVALVGGVAIAVTQRGNASRTRRSQRERYLDYLEERRAEMRRRAREVRARAEELDPAPEGLLDLVRDPARLWERRRSDADFLRVRIGVGDRRWFPLSVPDDPNPVQPYDPIMASEARSVADRYSVVAGMPFTIELDRAGQVAVVGDRAGTLAVARALIAQLGALHSPEDVHIAAAFPEEAAADWRGVDRLPHVVMPELYDGPVPARRVAAGGDRLRSVLGAELGERASRAATAKRSTGSAAAADAPRLVVFIDDHGRLASSLPVPDADLSLRDLRVTVVHLLSDRLHEPSDVTVRITVGGDRAVVTDARVEEDGAVPEHSVTLDATDPALVDALARTLAPLRLSLTRQDQAETAEAVDITELLGIEGLDLDPSVIWRPRSPRDFLRVPIGLDDNGVPVLLDIKESAQLGMGPHGIAIGATGSGKSELLRTLILGLALSHSPEDLSMVLVDYKGGAAFAPFQGLPHVAGIIDNLADDAQLTERARASIQGEVVRRQEVLRDAGSLPSIGHYRELRQERPDLPPLPHLFIVIDEFGELLTAEPDFVDLLLTIGRIGRSIGVHLLLSSQRIEAGKLRGLETYLSYRIGLRTFSEAESAVVLDTPDAFHLPAIPGYAYLKVDTTVYRRFRAGYVSGPAGELRRSVEIVASPEPLELPTYNGLASPDASTGEAELAAPSVGRALIDEVVDGLRGAATSTAPVWLPPLPARLALSRVLEGAPGSPLRPPIGLIDNPARQQQSAWRLDLTRSGGHVAILGAPGSGRSMFLRTVAASLSLTATPREVSIYGMDLTGGGLRRIEGFPHVGGVATRADRDRLRRLLEELLGMLAQRERVFRERSLDSVAALRTEHAAGRVPELISADIVVLVDGAGLVRTEFEELEPMLADLLQRGGSFGIHLVFAATRWNDFRMNQQPLIGTKLELRLGDPADSVIGRKLAATIRADQPGRLLTDDQLFAQVALPVLDDVDDDEVGPALEELARRTAASWEGPSAAPIRLLPAELDPAELPDALDEPDAVPIGLRQDTMEPVLLDVAGRDQHLLALGDTQSGKTTLLRGVVRGLVDRHGADELVLALMDVRGDLAPEIPDDYLGGHAVSSQQARALAEAIATELEKRQANPASGPRIVVVVDDYDILASGGTEPLRPLLPYLPSARDLRLNVVLTRPVAGASRAMYDPALVAIRDTGGTVLVMSGERGEGQLLPGVYAEAMVPGRGRLVRRGDSPRIMQVADFAPQEVGADAS